MNNNDNKKEATIIAICPICKKRFRDAEGERHIVAQYVLATPPAVPQQLSMPKITCTTCGIEFFPLAVIEELKKRIAGEDSRIIKVPGNISLVK